MALPTRPLSGPAHWCDATQGDVDGNIVQLIVRQGAAGVEIGVDVTYSGHRYTGTLKRDPSGKFIGRHITIHPAPTWKCKEVSCRLGEDEMEPGYWLLLGRWVRARE